METLVTHIATTDDLETSVNQLSLNTVGIGSVLFIALILLAIWVVKRKKNKLKLPIFLSILVVVLGTTAVISGGTVYLNINSFAGGPVHWHADVEFWACGNELELRDPSGFLSNKIGTATLHEHNDKRIHLEGVPISSQDASLGKFMRVVGGEVSKTTLTVPLNKDAADYFATAKGREDGDGNGAPAPELIDPYVVTDGEYKAAKFRNGENCGGQTSYVQVFAYKFDRATKTYKQTKLADPADYSISHYGDVPAGDCVIFEFAPAKDRTDKLCRQYGIRDKDKCERFGVEANKRAICEDVEVQ